MDINDITYKINGAVFEVNRILGPCFLEKVYENALVIQLRSDGLKVESQVPLNVFFKDKVMANFLPILWLRKR